MVEETKDWLDKTKEPALLNTGELADSFAVSTEYIKHIVPLFTAQKKHCISFLTKADWYPVEIPPHESIRLGWSINATTVAQKYEPKAPPPDDRIATAEKAKKSGHNVRIRIDPIMPIPNWHQEYKDLIDKLAQFRPDFITIRTLRAQGNLEYWAPNTHAKGGDNPFKDFAQYLVKDGDDRAKRIDPNLRIDIYRYLGQILDSHGLKWGLCKETTQVLTTLNKLNHMCNCLP